MNTGMMDEVTFGIAKTQEKGRLARWLERDRPAIIATAIAFPLFLILAAITLITGWASRPVTLLLQVILSFGAGILAAWLDSRQNPELPRPVRQGAFAGLYLPLSVAILITLLALVLALGSLGTLIPLMVPYFILLPIELGLCSFIGAGGAWLSSRAIKIIRK